MTDAEVIESTEEEPIVPDNESGQTIRLFPDVFISGMTAAVLLLCAYSVLCIFLPAALDVRANVVAPPKDPKPAWYFLFLYRYARSVPTPVAAITPGVLLVLLGALPFLDRNPSREPGSRIIALALAAIVVAGIAVLSYLGWSM